MTAACQGGQHLHHRHHHVIFFLLLMSLIRRALHQHHNSLSASCSAFFATAFHLNHRDITLERCRQQPYNSKITNFHTRRRNNNHHVVPSLPRQRDDANNNNSNSDDDVLYTLKSHQGEIIEIILLQHCSEVSKRTATGWLLNDTKYSTQFGSIMPTMNDLVGNHMKLTLWAWRGGAKDITMIEEQIKIRLKENNNRVYLLWKGGGATATNERERSADDDETINPVESYIIIDGTWQQAKKIYRKIPMLWSLPRISLTNVPPSIYVLRGDYTGWRVRFSNNDGDGSDLLCTACTAEVAAAVMDRCGDVECANLIRSRLDAFQSTFSHKRRF